MHSMLSVFRTVPSPGQVVRIKLNVDPGGVNRHRTAVYFTTKLKYRDASDRIRTVGLTFNKTEYDSYAARGDKLREDLTLPFEFGKYYGVRKIARRGCVRGRYVQLIIMRLYSYKARNKLDDVFLAVNTAQFNKAAARFKSRRDFGNLYNPLMRLLVRMKRRFGKQ